MTGLLRTLAAARRRAAPTKRSTLTRPSWRPVPPAFTF